LPRNRAREATIDTGCLIALQHLDLFSHLSWLFDRVYIPRRVREEFRKTFHSRKALARIVERLALYRYCNQVDEINLRLLLGERPSENPRSNEGEAEAVLQAAEIGAETVIVDDPHGRRWARTRGISCIGILGIIDILRTREIVASVSPLLEELGRRGYHLPAADVNRLRTKFQELAD
jgi:predicted nucleic acid-binding protein